MKRKPTIHTILYTLLAFTFIFYACSSDEGSGTAAPTISINNSSVSFSAIQAGTTSSPKSVSMTGARLTSSVSISVSGAFEISRDNTNYSSNISLTADQANQNNTISIRFSPSETDLGDLTGTITVTSNDFDTKQVALTGTALEIVREIQVLGTVNPFGDVTAGTMSTAQTVQVRGMNLENDVTATVSGSFEISKDNITFGNSVTYDHTAINTTPEDLYVRFSPTATDLGTQTATITLAATGVTDQTINLSGVGTAVRHNYQTFDSQRIAFGGGFNQTVTNTYNLHTNMSNIEQIMMYVELRCPTGGCNAWDVYANIKVKDDASGEFYEIGRYITPYGVDNSQLSRGFEIDVTDFKSLLQGNTELYARIETWGADGWELSVEFDYVEGTPDYEYYAIADVITYDDWSTSGVPYGVAIDPMTWDLTKNVMIPSNAESTHLRTIISGWGHATPVDSDNRPCAEWCFRTHDVKINGATTFQHNMEPMGCASNPVQPQAGNWTPDRAGWCPGMAVPVRVDQFSTPMNGSMFAFEYDYQDWTSDGGTTSGQGGAFYATSTFVVVKSSTPIAKPTVTD
ncbi:peptide-N-glycosidase F-related protein [uncultured Kordia sp.]|uniref:peptide-N-glycosidase F-related protein n=1 Tax=uncultured Kordia sp. TaxID=507699 RepID=UPI002606EC7F|nr:peptide-N-glycosidase F-related protein [uncultured Kordia sp.]